MILHFILLCDKLIGWIQEGEAQLLEKIQALAPLYRTRPSALGPLLRATGGALGALSVLLPRPYSEAIKGKEPYTMGMAL